MQTNGVDQYVGFSHQLSLGGGMSFLSQRAKNDGSIAFMKQVDFYERLAAFQMRRSLDDKRKRFINSR